LHCEAPSRWAGLSGQSASLARGLGEGAMGFVRSRKRKLRDCRGPGEGEGGEDAFDARKTAAM